MTYTAMCPCGQPIVEYTMQDAPWWAEVDPIDVPVVPPREITVPVVPPREITVRCAEGHEHQASSGIKDEHGYRFELIDG